MTELGPENQNRRYAASSHKTELPWAVLMQVWGLVPLVLSCWLDRLWSLPSLFFVVFAFLVVRLVSGPWRCDERLLWHLFALGPSCLGQCECRCGPFVRGQTQSQALCRFHMWRRKWPFMLNWGCGDYITSVQWVQGGSEVNQSPGITTPWSDSTQNSSVNGYSAAPGHISHRSEEGRTDMWPLRAAGLVSGP